MAGRTAGWAVDPFRRQLLAGARLAGDQHAAVRRRQTLDVGPDLSHLPSVADHGQLRGGGGLAASHGGTTEAAPDARHQLIERHRMGKVVVDSDAERGNGELLGAVRRDEDDRDPALPASEPPGRVQTAQRAVRRRANDREIERCDRVRGLALVRRVDDLDALRAENATESTPHRGVVLQDQDGGPQVAMCLEWAVRSARRARSS